MAGPRRKFRERPKKVGAKKNQRVKSQQAKLVKAGYDAEEVKSYTEKQLRDEIKKAAKKSAK